MKRPLFHAVFVLALAGVLPPVAATATAATPAEPPLVINGRVLDAAARARLEAASGTPLQPGRWWYDARSGLWGHEGQGAAGFARPGLDVGAPLSAKISGGRQGVFFNGRELTDAEVTWLRTLGTVIPGRYWLDAVGNVGFEGQNWAFANLWVLAWQRGGGAGGTNRTTRSGTWIASEGGCVIVSGRSSSGIGSFGASSC